MASEWIKQKSDQLREARKLQEHRREVLPAKAEDTWRGLIAWIGEDVQAMNTDSELHRRLRSRLTFKVEEHAPEFWVIQDQLPAMRLQVEFNQPAATVRAIRHTLPNPSSREIAEPLPLVHFDLDSQDNVFLTDDAGKKITFGQLSEQWLSPFLNTP